MLCQRGSPRAGFGADRIRVNSQVGAPSEVGQVSDCEDHNIQTISAGLSQCLIMDILNDVMQFGLECFASKGLHGLGLELNKGE